MGAGSGTGGGGGTGGGTGDGGTITTFYADGDTDGYGDPASSVQASSTSPPSGYVTDDSDCNDGNAAIHPGATEVTNGLDDDCDGMTDEGVLPALLSLDTPESVPVGTVSSGTVHLTGPVINDTVVQLVSSDSRILTTSNATVTAGQTSAGFSVTGIAPGEVSIQATLRSVTISASMQVVVPSTPPA